MPTARQRENLAGQEIAEQWLLNAESHLSKGVLPTRLADSFWLKIAYHYEGVYGRLQGLAETQARFLRVKDFACGFAIGSIELGKYPLVRQHFIGSDGTCSSITHESEPVALFDNDSAKIVDYLTVFTRH